MLDAGRGRPRAGRQQARCYPSRVRAAAEVLRAGGDEGDLAAWLAAEVCPVELSRDRLREALLVRCRQQRIEPPGRIDRIVGAAVAAFEERFCTEILTRLSPPTIERLEELIAGETDGLARVGGGRGLLSELKADPGRLGLETLLGEIDKLERIRGLGLADDLFGGYSEKLVAAWRARAATEYPSDLRAAGAPVRLTFDRAPETREPAGPGRGDTRSYVPTTRTPPARVGRPGSAQRHIARRPAEDRPSPGETSPPAARPCAWEPR